MCGVSELCKWCAVHGVYMNMCELCGVYGACAW